MVNHEILKFVIENQGNHFCQCRCNNLIIIKKYHYYSGIPKFIKNHGRKGKNHPLFGKISPFKNHNHTEESKKKNSDAHKGHKSWNEGLTSEIDNRIISGENHPSKRIEFRIKLSKERQGKNNPFYGKNHTEETKRKWNREGENNSNWNNGSSFEPYCYKFNKKTKEKIRDRDNRICQLCKKIESENKQKLSVHHVHYDKPNCYPDLISLCRSCNIKVNRNRDYWEQYFMEILK